MRGTRLNVTRFFLLTALVLVGATGCGATATLSRAEFIKKADTICEHANEMQLAGIKQARRQIKGNLSSQANQERLLLEYGLPPLSAQAEEVGALSIPAGSDQKVQAIIEGWTDAIEEVHGNPTRLTAAFVKVNGLAKQYGFHACAQAP